MMRRHPETALLLFYLEQAFGRRGWHGPTLSAAVRDVTVEIARWRPGTQGHSIWELVLHAAFWKHTVRQRLTGERSRFSRSPRNWPQVPEAGGAAEWRADVDLLKEEHGRLIAVVDAFPGARLHRKIAGTRYVPVEQILGIAAHDLYHCGQISLIKRLHESASMSAAR
jgi:hypothetical protein